MGFGPQEIAVQKSLDVHLLKVELEWVHSQSLLVSDYQLQTEKTL